MAPELGLGESPDPEILELVFTEISAAISNGWFDILLYGPATSGLEGEQLAKAQELAAAFAEKTAAYEALDGAVTDAQNDLITAESTLRDLREWYKLIRD
jgi:hypothetical protein